MSILSISFCAVIRSDFFSILLCAAVRRLRFFPILLCVAVRKVGVCLTNSFNRQSLSQSSVKRDKMTSSCRRMPLRDE